MVHVVDILHPGRKQHFYRAWSVPYADELATQGSVMCKFDGDPSHSLRKTNIMRIILMVTPLHENVFRINVLIVSIKNILHKHLSGWRKEVLQNSCDLMSTLCHAILLDLPTYIVAPIWFWSKDNVHFPQLSLNTRWCLKIMPESKVHGANMGPIWGRQDPGGPNVGPMNFAIWDSIRTIGKSLVNYSNGAKIWKKYFNYKIEFAFRRFM